MPRKKRPPRQPEPSAPRKAPPEPRVLWLHTFGARVAYYLTYALAAFSLSRVIHYGRAIGGDPGVREGIVEGGVLGAVWAAVLLTAMFVLAMYVYEDLRWKGELTRRSALFEKILTRGGPRNG